MSKKANILVGFDWAASEAAIAIQIDKVVQNKTGCEDSEKLLAKEIIMVWKLPSTVDFNSFAKQEELAKLQDLQHAVRKLKSVWNSLDKEIQRAFRAAASSRRFEGNSGVSTATEQDLLSFIHFGPEMLDRMIPLAKESVRQGKRSGRQNFAEIRLVNQCARVWERRTGKSPKSEKHAGFAGFVADVFYAIGIDTEEISVSNTIRAWSKYNG